MAGKGVGERYRTQPLRSGVQSPVAPPSTASTIPATTTTVGDEKPAELVELESRLSELPEELQQAYKSGGVEGYNAAVQTYNAGIEARRAEYDAARAAQDAQDRERLRLSAGGESQLTVEQQERERQLRATGTTPVTDEMLQKIGMTREEYESSLSDVQEKLAIVDSYRAAGQELPPEVREMVYGKAAPFINLSTREIDVVGALKAGVEETALQTVGVTQESLAGARAQITLERKYGDDLAKAVAGGDIELVRRLYGDEVTLGIQRREQATAQLRKHIQPDGALDLTAAVADGVEPAVLRMAGYDVSDKEYNEAKRQTDTGGRVVRFGGRETDTATEELASLSTINDLAAYMRRYADTGERALKEFGYKDADITVAKEYNAQPFVRDNPSDRLMAASLEFNAAFFEQAGYDPPTLYTKIEDLPPGSVLKAWQKARDADTKLQSLRAAATKSEGDNKPTMSLANFQRAYVEARGYSTTDKSPKAQSVRMAANTEYARLYGSASYIGSVATETASLAVSAVRVAHPDAKFRDISGLEWGLSGVQVALLALPATGSLLGTIGSAGVRVVQTSVMVVSGAAMTYSTVKNWTRMSPVERVIAVAMDGLVVAGAIGASGAIGAVRGKMLTPAGKSAKIVKDAKAQIYRNTEMQKGIDARLGKSYGETAKAQVRFADNLSKIQELEQRLKLTTSTTEKLRWERQLSELRRKTPTLERNLYDAAVDYSREVYRVSRARKFVEDSPGLVTEDVGRMPKQLVENTRNAITRSSTKQQIAEQTAKVARLLTELEAAKVKYRLDPSKWADIAADYNQARTELSLLKQGDITRLQHELVAVRGKIRPLEDGVRRAKEQGTYVDRGTETELAGLRVREKELVAEYTEQLNKLYSEWDAPQAGGGNGGGGRGGRGGGGRFGEDGGGTATGTKPIAGETPTGTKPLTAGDLDRLVGTQFLTLTSLGGLASVEALMGAETEIASVTATPTRVTPVTTPRIPVEVPVRDRDTFPTTVTAITVPDAVSPETPYVEPALGVELRTARGVEIETPIAPDIETETPLRVSPETQTPTKDKPDTRRKPGGFPLMRPRDITAPRRINKYDPTLGRFIRDEPAERLADRLRLEPSPQTNIRTRLALKTPVPRRPATPIRTPTPLPRLPIMPLGSGGRVDVAVPQGSLAWRQGAVWKYIPAPWNEGKPRTLQVPPSGANTTGRTPQETLQVIGKRPAGVPRTVTIDMGVTDILISDYGHSIRFSGRGERTNVGGDDLDSPTTGMTIDLDGFDDVIEPRPTTRRPHNRRVIQRARRDDTATISMRRIGG